MSIRLPMNPGLGGLDELTSSEELFLQNLAGLTYAQGDILYHDGNDLVNLGPGTNGQYLQTQGAAADPQWATVAGGGDLLADGTVPLTANWDVGAFTITGTQFISDIVTGTAPFVVASTTEVANLKAATSGNSDTVTTNANLTGHITSIGNAAVLGTFTVAQLSTALSDASISGNNTGDEPSADLTTPGIIEIATIAETNTGTDATRAVSPDGLDGWTGSAQIATVGTLSAGDVDAAVTDASATAKGKVELATIAETNTGTDTARAVTPDGLSSAVKSIMLSAGGGAPLTTAGCSDPTKVEAATNDINYFVLDFDTTTEEHAFWNFPMPDNWDAGVVNATFYWTNAAGLTTETVDWGIAAGSWGNDDAIDAALGTEVTTTDTWIAQGDMHISAASGNITVANAAAGEWTTFVVARKVASDNLTGDARLLSVKIEYTINKYSE